eukprot:SAG31_NODE_9932_length_1208_cov_2.251578_1_plen_90_part_10
MDTPYGRGFDTFLGFFEGGEDYYDHTVGPACGRQDVHDLYFAPAGTAASEVARTMNRTLPADRGRPAVLPARSGPYSTELYTNFLVQRIG